VQVSVWSSLEATAAQSNSFAGALAAAASSVYTSWAVGEVFLCCGRIVFISAAAGSRTTVSFLLLLVWAQWPILSLLKLLLLLALLAAAVALVMTYIARGEYLVVEK